jgi:hypothetical protein
MRQLWLNWDSILAFVWGDWGMSWSTSDSTASESDEIRIKHIRNTGSRVLPLAQSILYNDNIMGFGNYMRRKNVNHLQIWKSWEKSWTHYNSLHKMAWSIFHPDTSQTQNNHGNAEVTCLLHYLMLSSLSSGKFSESFTNNQHNLSYNLFVRIKLHGWYQRLYGDLITPEQLVLTGFLCLILCIAVLYSMSTL